ncbi:MAG: IclR family transcriptional regulator [Pseudochelatococcus sp.]|jgi:DNA-binding IclR family transcriptional regulator|uniref:IclR family transcriptional regulator n=1 Tax=Pseudochelatococcus sp. TaxID=2020869 RepID=UPI003D8EA40C
MQKNDDAAGNPKTFVGAVSNAVCILRYLAHAPAPAGVAQIARATHVNTSTCFNILRTLAAEGLVDFDETGKTYGLAMGVLEFALPLLAADPVDLIRPVISDVSRGQDTLVALWKITAFERLVLIDRVVENRIVHIDMQLGTRLPSFIGAVGRCVAASRALGELELRRKFQELRWSQPPGFDQYAAEVRQANIDGYAFDLGNLYRAIDIVGAVVCDHSGAARFGLSAIGIAGMKSPDQLHEVGRSLRQAAERISLNLFGRKAAVVREAAAVV